MHYILNEKIALRSWWLVPYGYYTRYRRWAKGLRKEEYDFLAKCDGECNLPENELARTLCERGLCRPVKKGSVTLSDWQKPMSCENRYMPSINWMITGKCNYNCLHCFNAKDNAPLQSEFSWGEAQNLIEEAKKCGINGFTITGGEPMVHKHFIDIVREIYSHGMYIFELNTNGFYLTQEILDEMKQIGCYPVMKISFDGVGYHDYLRGHKGAEKDALRAIKLCVSNGFNVRIQMQLNRENKDTIVQSLKLLDQMNCGEARLIRTGESPRWEKNSRGTTLTFPEYYDACLEIAKEYTDEDHQMLVTFNQFLRVSPKEKTYMIYGDHSKKDVFRENLPLCRSSRGMLAVGSDGQVYPCLQMSGWFLSQGISLGNVKTMGLQKILQDSDCLHEICTTVGNLTDKNERCRHCLYLEQCRGGCPTHTILTSGTPWGCDLSKCQYFEGRYPEKITKALNGYLHIES